MVTLISVCGLDCSVCEARIATINNDDEMRKATAEKWQAQFNAPFIPPESINCTGCRMEGVKIGHWQECGIRLCAVSKGYATCGECYEIETCSNISHVLNYSPDALTNLRSLYQ